MTRYHVGSEHNVRTNKNPSQDRETVARQERPPPFWLKMSGLDVRRQIGNAPTRSDLFCVVLGDGRKAITAKTRNHPEESTSPLRTFAPLFCGLLLAHPTRRPHVAPPPIVRKKTYTHVCNTYRIAKTLKIHHGVQRFEVKLRRRSGRRPGEAYWDIRGKKYINKTKSEKNREI